MDELSATSAISQHALPRPAVWSRRDRSIWATPIWFIVPLLVLVAAAVARETIVGGAAIGVAALGLVCLAVLLPRPRPPRVELGEVRLPDAVLRGPWFPIRSGTLTAVLWGLLSVVLCGAAVALLVAAIVQNEWAALVGIVILGGIGLVFGVGALAHVLRDRTNPPGLTVSDAGIVLVTTGTRIIAWHELADVVATVHEFRSRGLVLRQNAIRFDLADDGDDADDAGGSVLVRTITLDTDPLLVYHAARYYLRHPRARAELGQDGAVDRIRAGRL